MKLSKKTNIIFHIGYHKTATTFLQKQIFPNLTNTKFISSQNNNKNIYQLLQSNYNNINDNILISKESYSGSLNLNENKKIKFNLANKIKKNYPKAKIIITIRKQEDWILSYYVFCLKNFYIHRSINNIIQKNLNYFTSKLSYFDLLYHYINLFGFNNVLIIPVEMLSKQTEEVFKKIEIFTGEKLLRDKINFSLVNNSNYNVIYVFLLIFFSKIINLFVYLFYFLGLFKTRKKPKEYFSFIEKILNFIFTNKKFRISINKKNKKILDDFFDENNYKLSKLININLKNLGYSSKDDK